MPFLDREDLGKNINADEAAAMGAVYQAAALSKAFKVKTFLIRDAAVFPVQVSATHPNPFESRRLENGSVVLQRGYNLVVPVLQVEFNREVEEDGAKTLKHSKRILFQRMAPYPQRKVITFNRYTDDFAFDINYGDLNFLSQEDIRLEDFVHLV